MPNPYLTSKVMTASPHQLLLMLYDGAIQFTERAIRHLQQKQLVNALEPLSRALAIVQELQSCLNPKHAPELCQNLENLYMFMEDQILRAQRERSAAPLLPVATILKDLREAWAKAIQSISQPNNNSARVG